MIENLIWKLSLKNIKKHKLESIFIFCALIISNLAILLTLAIINGFNSQFISTFLKFESDYRITKNKDIPLNLVIKTKELTKKLNKIKVKFSPVLETEGLLKANGYVAGIKILGIPFQQTFYNFKKLLTSGQPLEEEGNLICGARLAQKLKLTPRKSKVKLVTSEQEKYFKVAGTFETGLCDYDTYYVFVPKETLSKMLDIPLDFSSYIEIKTTDKTDKRKLSKLLLNYKYTTLRKRNAALFLALKLEKYAAFIVLSFMFILATLLIGSLFIFQIINQKKNIAILKVFGFSDTKILKIFFYQALIYYTFSFLITGLLYSLTVLYLNNQQITLPENIYLIATFPLKTVWSDIIMVIIFSFVLINLSLFIPYYLLKKVDPSLVISQRD